jgi:hypothetical protein
LRCFIWIIFRVSSPSWRQSCLHENLGPDSLSQLSTASSSVPLGCERHSLALFPQTCFASAYTGSACDRGSRNKHTQIEIRRSDGIVVRSRTALGRNCARQIPPSWAFSAFSPTFTGRPSFSCPDLAISGRHTWIHHAITNDACSTVEDHVCSNKNSENRHLMGTELPNEIFSLTKTPFAGCLHRR